MDQKFNCAVPNCTAYVTAKESQKFPENLEMSLKWASAIGVPTFKKSWRVCNAHFDEEEDFHTGPTGFKRRKNDKVPSKNLPMVSLKIISFHQSEHS